MRHLGCCKTKVNAINAFCKAPSAHWAITELIAHFEQAAAAEVRRALDPPVRGSSRARCALPFASPPQKHALSATLVSPLAGLGEHHDAAQQHRVTGVHRTMNPHTMLCSRRVWAEAERA